MALMKDLEEELTCPIHLDLYTEPMLLQCLHILCKTDIDRLTQPTGNLECPQCKQISRRNDIKRDFRTQRLLDLRTARKEKLKREQKCDGCEDEVASVWCYDCKVHLCGRCEKTHLKLSISASHKLEKIDKVIAIKEQRKASIKKTLKSIKKCHKYKYMGDVDRERIDIEDKNEHIMQKLSDSERELTKDIHKMYALMREQLLGVVREETQRLDTISASAKDFDNKLTALQDMLRANDTKILLDDEYIKGTQIDVWNTLNTLQPVLVGRSSPLDDILDEQVVGELIQTIKGKTQELRNKTRHLQITNPGTPDKEPARKLPRASTSFQPETTLREPTTSTLSGFRPRSRSPPMSLTRLRNRPQGPPRLFLRSPARSLSPCRSRPQSPPRLRTRARSPPRLSFRSQFRSRSRSPSRSRSRSGSPYRSRSPSRSRSQSRSSYRSRSTSQSRSPSRSRSRSQSPF